MDRSTITKIIGGILGVFIFLVGAYMLTSKPQATFFPELTQVLSTDHLKWSPEKKHILIEYSDFQCPACSTYAGLINSLDADTDFQNNIKKQITFVYRSFPLDSIHKNARVSVYAAEAAGKQGKFYEMHDLLFTNQSEWAESDNPKELFKQYAEELKLDIQQFESDETSPAVKEKVEKDYQSGLAVDVQATPTFYLNGKKMKNFQSADELKNILLLEMQSRSS